MTEFATTEELLDYLVPQRWSGVNDREVAGLSVLDHGTLRHRKRPLAVLLVEVRYAPGTTDIFQLLVAGRAAADGLENPVFARALVELARSGANVPTLEGAIEFRASGTLLDAPLEHGTARHLGIEQSNSSVVVDERLILKVYRRLDAGTNPELEMLRFLGSHGFRNVPELGGWWTYSGPLMTTTLGTMQRFIPGAVDGWSLALDELRQSPEAFLGRLERLGEVIGAMHVTLASDSEDPAFAPEEISAERYSLLAATMDDEIDRVFGQLPEDDSVARIAGSADALRDLVRSLAPVGPSGRLIRQHGDLHLGQLLWAEGDWVVVDFEGEPARPLPERRRKRSPLRDVAGMLRSFAYVSTVAGLGEGDFEERAGTVFLDAYMGVVQSAGILPASIEATNRLIEIFELEKAVYELRYELAHRPDWVGIPVAGIERLLERSAG
jgi:maltokinase